MANIIDCDESGFDASVLTETEGRGLLRRSLLHDESLAARLDAEETPRYVLHNGDGVTVERPDGTESVAPAGRYSGLAAVTDARVLFAVGGRDGDRTLSVPLADVVTVSIESGVLEGALVVETVEDVRYRFPCRGDLDPVREYIDTAAGVWARAQRQVERAEQRLDELYEALDSGDADTVLAGLEELRGMLDGARAEAARLDAARERVDDRAAAVADELTTLERRAHVERAEQARERAHVRWDDSEYGAAFDHFDDAANAYAAAADVDAARPSDALLERRRETLANERDRLAAAPVDRAEHATDRAAAADDPSAAVDWWETAIERYDTALSLDWGRDERRFEGDPPDLREDLTDAARNLVEAYCDLAREYVADAEDELADAEDERESSPGAAQAAYDLAAEALDDASAVARERVPDATDEIERVRETLEERRADLSTADGPPDTEVDGGRASARLTAVDRRPVGSSESEHDEDERDRSETDTATSAATSSETSSPAREWFGGSESEGGETGDAGSDGESSEEGVTDPAAVDPEQFASLVAALFREAGWSATLFQASRESQYDLLAETDGPVGVSACVWTIHPDAVAAVDAARVERYAAYADRTDEGDAAVVCSAAPLSPTARERADEYGVKILDGDALADRLELYDVDPTEF